MEAWAQQLVNALTIGGMYTLVAIGFTLFFGVLGLINFAHGEIFMLGAFAALFASTLLQKFGVDQATLVIFLMFGFSMAFCAVTGAAIERFAYKPLRGMPKLILLITSLAVSIVIREAVKEFYPQGSNPLKFFSPPPTRYSFGGVVLDATQIWLIVASTALIFALYLLVTKTWMGRAMRAIAEDQDAARMMGVDVNVVIRNTFLIGSALGAAAGAMNGLYYTSIRFDMGWLMAIKGFTAAVIGGLGNVYGAMVGGYILAVLEVLIVALVPGGSEYKDVFVFLLLILILVFRPSGVFKKAPEKMG